MIHKRTFRIEFIDDIRYAKTIIVDVGLDRKKEWELTIKDLGLKVNDNKINFAKKEIKQQLKQLHQDYIEDKLEEELNTIVDLGGKVEDVIVEHPLYGEIKGNCPRERLC